MQKVSELLRICAVCTVLIALVGCPGSERSSATSDAMVSTTATTTVTTVGTGNGAQTTYALSTGMIFAEVEVASSASSSNSIVFPMGFQSNVGTIQAPFTVALTETTTEQWTTVYNWATNNGSTSGTRADGGPLYSFATVGNLYTSMYWTPTPKKPVVWIGWRDAIVWCNALTEYYNANRGANIKLDCVYYTDASYTTPLRTSTNSDTITYGDAGSQDDPYIKAATKGNTDMEYCTAKGFRLPTSVEFECASRYYGTSAGSRTDLLSLTMNNDYALEITPGYYWLPPDYASGATANCDTSAAASKIAVFNTSAPAEVKSKDANDLGLYDMSGNVSEFCFDWNPEYKDIYRMHRGGDFQSSGVGLKTGNYGGVDPGGSAVGSREHGFRFARTK
jgi:formylglycine-generating enzyme